MLLFFLVEMKSSGAEQRSWKTGIRVIFEEQLVAWCIVPSMVASVARRTRRHARDAWLQMVRLRLSRRACPSFDAEMEALKRHHVRCLPGGFRRLNAEARLILDVLKRHSLRQVQLWVTGGGEPTRSAAEQQARVASEANRVRAIADEAGRIGCTVALYNHGAWFGEPENQIQIIERLRSRE